ncbi:MAG: hemolysin family protein [Candidatus Cyclobacteriaceae bacterium M3_2C_046]
MEYNYLIGIIICLIFSALFSGLEIAFVSADKLQIELQGKRGQISGKILSGFLKRPSTFISTMLVGNNIALVVYGIYMANILTPVIDGLLPEYLDSDATVLILQTIVATLVVLITAEFTPKSIFLLNPNWLLNLFAPIIWGIYIMMYPIVQSVLILSKFVITRILRFEYSEDKPVFGLIDLNNYIKNNLLHDEEEENQEINTRIFNNALEFKTVKVRECMIPRTELEAVDVEDGIEELKEAFISSGHSKILVYRNSIDDIIGFCHSLELFRKPRDINAILNPIIIVPETMLANELMIQFITEHKSIALVVDEFGGTSGLVTMEDIIEEIFGDIQDEHDLEEWVDQKLDEKNYLLSARHEIDYLNEKYRWDIPTGDYDTLGGFILSITENIPEINEVIEFSSFTFTIVSMQDTRIDTVKITLNRIKENNE